MKFSVQMVSFYVFTVFCREMGIKSRICFIICLVFCHVFFSKTPRSCALSIRWRFFNKFRVFGTFRLTSHSWIQNWGRNRGGPASSRYGRGGPCFLVNGFWFFLGCPIERRNKNLTCCINWPPGVVLCLKFVLFIFPTQLTFFKGLGSIYTD